MTADVLLSRLSGVRETGPSRWLALCPAHDDRRPSLSLRELEDGRVLVYCWAGCETQAVLDSVGLQFSDLYPPRAIDHRVPRVRPRFNARDLIQIAGREALVVALSAEQIGSGQPLNETDHARLMDAAARLQRIAHEAA